MKHRLYILEPSKLSTKERPLPPKKEFYKTLTSELGNRLFFNGDVLCFPDKPASYQVNGCLFDARDNTWIVYLLAFAGNDINYKKPVQRGS